MSLLRRLPVTRPDVNLEGLPPDASIREVGDYLNVLLSHARDRVVVLVPTEKSVDPEHGELLLTPDDRLWIALKGTYVEVCLAPCGGIVEPVVPEEVTVLVDPEREVFIAVGEYTGATNTIITGTVGKKIHVAWMEFSNGADASRTAHIEFSDNNAELCKTFLRAEGGTTLKNFVGAELTKGGTGENLEVHQTTDGTGSLYVTVAYLLV